MAASAEKKALEVSSTAMAKASEVADLAKVRAAEVSSMAISKALDASTLAAEKAAQAAVAAAQVATATSLDLTYIKKDIADTKNDIKDIKLMLDDKYVNKEEFTNHLNIDLKYHDDEARRNDALHASIVTKEQFTTVQSIVFGLVGLILTSVFGGLMYMLIHK